MPHRLFVFLVAIYPAALAGTPPFTLDTLQPATKLFRKRVVASGLGSPWEITWGPDGYLWVTERAARQVTRVHPQSGVREVAVRIAEAVAPGGQDGVLGLALHPELLQHKRNDYVFIAYTYVDRTRPPSPFVPDPASPYRFMAMKVVRFTYAEASQTLSSPITVIDGLPAGNDHNAGRLKIGPDLKLYLTLGDQGHNQFGNFCYPVESQRLPTQGEISARNFAAYTGKTLRINLDGSIPSDNPRLNGVVSHINTYGHRNPQGIAFGSDGTLYAGEHGPKTDDEINILKPGGNYGWPRVAGYRDDSAYAYLAWGESATPCRELKFSDYGAPSSVPHRSESSFTGPITEPIATLFTVPTGYNFRSPACGEYSFICWPTVAISSIEAYESGAGGIPGWDKVLLVTALKRGSLYVVALKPHGQSAAGGVWRYFHTPNRYRDTAVSPDRRTIFVATDPHGLAEAPGGEVTSEMHDPGAILAFTYEKESTAAEASAALRPAAVSRATAQPAAQEAAGLSPPQFTAAQAEAGKLAYNSSCAVCHGANLASGTMGPSLSGAVFERRWKTRTLLALFNKVKAMPPSAQNSLTADAYAAITAYLLQALGAQPGGTALPLSPEALRKMSVR